MSNAVIVPRPGKLGLALVLETLLSGAFLILIVFPLMMSPMIFDSGETNSRWAFFTALWLSPLVVLAGIVAAWIAYGVRVYWLSIAGLVAAGIPIALAAGTTAFFYADAAFAR
ncbi:MAG: hypothetical protein WBQ17_17695 [Rhizomicrobium sp.]|jgi:hypothetical protein